MKLHGLKTRGIFFFRIPRSGIRPEDHSSAPLQTWFSGCRMKIRQFWAIFFLALKKFFLIDGTQRAAAFAYYAFFSVFPFIIIFLTIASGFVERQKVENQIINYIENYIPISSTIQQQIIKTVSEIVLFRFQAGIFAFIILIWLAIQFFLAIILAVNRAWNIRISKWWKLPLKSLFLLIIVLVLLILSMVFPVISGIVKDRILPMYLSYSGFNNFIRISFQWMITFVSMSLFYMIAPRMNKRFNEIWLAAILATIFLQICASFFVLYLESFTDLNAVYGVFSGIMALLLWIYLCGCIFIFGACFCASQSEVAFSGIKK